MKLIYGVRVCLRFARGTWGCQKMTLLNNITYYVNQINILAT